MIFIGIDPDLHTTAIAVADLEKVRHLEVVRVPSKLKGHDAVLAMAQESRRVCMIEHAVEAIPVIESQRVYSRHDKANPNSLILLAQVTGAFLNDLENTWGGAQLVYPQDWKGQQDKYINQGFTYKHYGWEYTIHDNPKNKKDWYCVPEIEGFDVRDSDWKHLGDALGIALWAAKEHARKARIEKRRGA